MSPDGTFRTGEPAGADPEEDEELVRMRWSGTDVRTPGDGPTGEAHRSALAAYALRRPDTRVAELGSDSVFGTGLRSGAEAGPRYLAFHSGETTIRLEVTEYGGLRDIVGQVTPGGTARVEVHWPRGHRDPGTDSDGAFVARDIPAGPVSLTVRLGPATVISTRWTRV